MRLVYPNHTALRIVSRGHDFQLKLRFPKYHGATDAKNFSLFILICTAQVCEVISDKFYFVLNKMLNKMKLFEKMKIFERIEHETYVFVKRKHG